MNSPRNPYLVLVVLFVFCVNSSQSISESKSNEQTKQPHQQCTLYMAPSSIPNAGFGVYTTRKIGKHKPVTNFLDSPSIIVTDIETHTGNDLGDFWTHVDYLWSGAGLGEFEGKEVTENVFNLGCLSNFHTFLKNLHPYTAPYDDSYLDRSSDPGAGAFTYHEGHIFEATREIQAGEELFADYGEEWLDTREGTFADEIPRYGDFNTASKVFGKLEKSVKAEKVEMKDDILSTIVDVVSVFDNRVGNALPRSIDDFNDIMANKLIDAKKLLAEKTTLKRNTTWIQENGICLELIKPGRSTIKQAGRGAFATSFIEKGSVVSPMPLNTIVDKDMMLMYPLESDAETGQKEKVEDSEPVGQQLVVNYCFGHSESNLLLCPMTNSILINHCSTRSVGEGDCNEKGPNAKVQWATTWDKDTSEWLNKSIDEIIAATELGHRGLSLEVIATRDIAPGEEVFIDYGKNWEEAWMEHIQSWQPPNPSTTGTYGSIKKLRENKDHRTLAELETNPYPDNVILVCYFPSCDDHDDENSVENDEITETKYAGSRIKSDNVEKEESLYECEIVKKSSNRLTVRVYCPNTNSFLVSSYSNELVTFRMKPYHSDQHLPGVFRHSIEIDDDMFPEHWKNTKSN